MNILFSKQLGGKYINDLNNYQKIIQTLKSIIFVKYE